MGALLDFLEKPEKVSDTDKAEKVGPALLPSTDGSPSSADDRSLAVNLPLYVQIACFLASLQFSALHAAIGHGRVTVLMPKLACTEAPWL